jgi:hypothetical protein
MIPIFTLLKTNLKAKKVSPNLDTQFTPIITNPHHGKNKRVDLGPNRSSKDLQDVYWWPIPTDGIRAFL